MSAAKLESHADPQKAPYFYLSHARADDESSVHDFFTDLSSSIRFKAKLTSTEVVGRWNTSRQERDEALRTSRVMIALLSPAYFRDKAALLEWKIFDLRRRSALLASHLSNRETLKRSIIPICWSPCSGSMPLEISQTPLFEGDSKSGPNATGGVQSLANNQYAAFVNSLARYIIEVTSSFQLTPLEAIPDEVSNVFEDREESEMNSQPTDPQSKRKIKNLNQNFLIIDGAFFKTVAKGIEETEGKLKDATIPSKTAKETYSVFAVVDDENLRHRIEAVSKYHKEQFHIEIFNKPNSLLQEAKVRLPDLFIVSLDLSAEEMSGRQLIETLTENRQIRSAVIVIYKARTDRWPHASDFGGAVGCLRSDITQEELLKRMTRWARVGRNRIRRSARDQARKSRPVFLSYSSKDQKGADHICYQLAFDEIEVWYAEETLKPGDRIFREVKAGLESAQIFIALMSRNYERSHYTHLELDDVYSKNEDAVIPVLYKCTIEELQDMEIPEWCRTKTPIIISADTPEFGFQQLFRTIQDRLG